VSRASSVAEQVKERVCAVIREALAANVHRARGRQPAFVLEDHIYYLFTQIVGRRNRRIVEKLRRFGITVPKWRVLAALHARPAVTMNQLAELTTIERTTLTRTIDAMARARLVERRADARDRRNMRLRLQAKGERLFSRILPLVLEENENSTRGIGRRDLDRFRRMLFQMIENLDRAPAKANENSEEERQ